MDNKAESNRFAASCVPQEMDDIFSVVLKAGVLGKRFYTVSGDGKLLGRALLVGTLQKSHGGGGHVQESEEDFIDPAR